MARLFITGREMNFISHITKEVIKDINEQKIIYYPISHLKTLTHELYNEALDKIFDNPISIDALVSATYDEGNKIFEFGTDANYKLEAYVQYRDLIDKKIELNIGDIISYGEIFYEINNFNVIKTLFGQVEHKDGYKIFATRVRMSQFKTQLLGPTSIKYSDEDATQTHFVQQRGFAENKLGKTGDIRELYEKGILERPISAPREVLSQEDNPNQSGYESSFYGDEEN